MHFSLGCWSDGISGIKTDFAWNPHFFKASQYVLMLLLKTFQPKIYWNKKNQLWFKEYSNETILSMQWNPWSLSWDFADEKTSQFCSDQKKWENVDFKTKTSCSDVEIQAWAWVWLFLQTNFVTTVLCKFYIYSVWLFLSGQQAIVLYWTYFQTRSQL